MYMFKCLCLVFILHVPLLVALPVDVSFLIVDLKWHEERGAQVCEIQHGVRSAFKGYAMLHEEHERIADKVLGILNGYFRKSWVKATDFADPGLRKQFINDPHWSCFESLKELEKQHDFLVNGARKPKNPYSLKDYQGFVFLSPSTKMNRKAFCNKYPGVVLIDNAFDGYAQNKYKMTTLLMGDPYTEAHKPIWGHYFTKDANVAERILEDIPSDLLVIKPLREYCGRGVIILKREDLKATLDDLFDKKKRKERREEDPAYKFWKNGNTSEFIVEEFIDSTPIFVPHLGKTYYPSMRLVFLLFYDQEIRIECLGGYYNLPSVSLEEGGSLNEMCKSASTIPYFEKVEPGLLKEAAEQIKKVLYIVYQKQLGS